jgi:hypothetical protein
LSRSVLLSIFLLECSQSLLEGFHGTSAEASADDSVSSILVGDSSVDPGLEVVSHDLPDVNSDGVSEEIEDGDLEELASTGGDLLVLLSDPADLLVVGGESLDKGRSALENESAESGGLSDGAVSHIAAHICLLVVAKEVALGEGSRGGEPLISQSGHSDAEFVTITSHAGDDGAVGDVVDGIQNGLADGHHHSKRSSHTRASGEVLVVEPIEDGDDLVVGDSSFEHAERKFVGEEAGEGIVSVVGLVTHLEGLLKGEYEIDGSSLLQGLGQIGSHALSPPDDVLDVVVVAKLLGQISRSAEHGVLEGGVLDDEDGEGSGDGSGHGSGGVMVVIGLEINLSSLAQVISLLRSLGPALKNANSLHSTFLGISHVLPVDRGSRQKHQFAFGVVQSRDDLSGRSDVLQNDLGAVHSVNGLEIGCLNFLGEGGILESSKAKFLEFADIEFAHV